MTTRRADSGQTLVEAALVVPLMLGAFLCMLQILLLAHARVMLQYAAFNAARAGVVYNGSRDEMRAAATISMLPIYCRTDTFAAMFDPGPGGCLRVLPTLVAGTALDSLSRNLEDFVTSLGVNATLALPQVALVDVTAVNPVQDDFKDSKGNSIDEIDFDLPSRVCAEHNASACAEVDANALRKTRLTIYVSAIVPMQIPIGGRLVSYYFLIVRYLGGSKLPTGILNWLDAQDTHHRTLEDIVAAAPFATQLAGAGGVKAMIREELMYTALRLLALDAHVFLFPLETSYSMPMESNFYRNNL